MDRRDFLTAGAAGAAGLMLGRGRAARAIIEPDPCVPGLSYISGDVAGTVPMGETWQVIGNVNQTGDLIVEGLLSNGVDTFRWAGNGHQILAHHGGRVDLAGKPKTPWCRWGDPTAGWEVGDLLAVAPTTAAWAQATETIWTGSWATMARPLSSPDVQLVDGTTARPEVVNLSRTVRISNVSRMMFHHQAGVQSLRDLMVVDSGVRGVEDFYPIHFHQNGESVRGSLVRNVLVWKSDNRAFVPHGSHGVTFDGCAAFRTIETPYWWNPLPFDRSDDILWDRCLAMKVVSDGGPGSRNAGFELPHGARNVLRGSVAAVIGGNQNAAGFLWPVDGGQGWTAERLVAHNCWGAGAVHYVVTGDVDGFVSYRNQRAGFAFLTYRAGVDLADLVLTENSLGQSRNTAVENRGVSQPSNGMVITYDGVNSDGELTITPSSATATGFVEVHNATFTKVRQIGSGVMFRFHDCGLTPADFIIESGGGLFSIVESGVEVHRYESGVWV